MELEITGITDKGTKDEQVVLHVDRNTNLKDFMIVDLKFFGPLKQAEKGKHIFSFPDKEVKEGETIIVKTGPISNGLEYRHEENDGNNYHYFTFGFDENYSIWGGTNCDITLLRIADYFNDSFKNGRIFVSGEGISLDRKSSRKVRSARVIGVMDLGKNNGDNSYGWSGIKPVVVTEESLFLLDFAEETIILDEKGDVIESSESWTPSKKDITTYRLYQFPTE